MLSEALNVTGTTMQKMPRATEQIDTGRKNVKDEPASSQGDNGSKNIQSEELLKQIKGLTEDGPYSVRFENDERSNVMVVKLVDSQTLEVIRQVPAEELLGLKASLAELQGNVVDTES